jgi:hypothetical protein
VAFPPLDPDELVVSALQTSKGDDRHGEGHGVSCVQPWGFDYIQEGEHPPAEKPGDAVENQALRPHDTSCRITFHHTTSAPYCGDVW